MVAPNEPKGDGCVMAMMLASGGIGLVCLIGWAWAVYA